MSAASKGAIPRLPVQPLTQKTMCYERAGERSLKATG